MNRKVGWSLLAAPCAALAGLAIFRAFDREHAPAPNAELSTQGAEHETVGTETTASEALVSRAEEAQARTRELGVAARPCSELFESGDLWVQWLDRRHCATSAPRAVLRAVPQPLAEPSMPLRRTLIPDHAGETEQLWKRASIAALGAGDGTISLLLELQDFFPGGETIAVPEAFDRSGALELALPPHGALEIRVVEPALGLEPAARLSVAIAPLGSRRPSEDLEMRGQLGKALVFERLRLGQRFTASAELLRGLLRDQIEAPALSFDGEERELAIAIGSGNAVLSGRIVDERGDALAELKVSATWHVEGSSPFSAPIVSDRHGRFAWTPERRGAPSTRTGALTLRTHDGGASGSRPIEVGSAGVFDLGDLQILPPRGDLVGCVAHVDGTPAMDAYVKIRGLYREAGGLSEIAGGLETVRTSRRGRFAWKARDARDLPTRFTLYAELDGERSALEFARVGEQDVRLVLGAAGKLRGRLLADREDLEQIRLSLRFAVNEVGDTSPSKIVECSSDGRFEFTSLPPGIYELHVRCVSVASELLAIRGVHVPAGETSADSRLDPIDLRSALTEFAFEPEPGASSQGAHWFRRSGSESAGWRSLPPPRSGRLRWLLPPGAYDFVFDLEKRRRETLLGCTEGRRFATRPCLRVRVQIDGDPGPIDPREAGVGFELLQSPPASIASSGVQGQPYELELPCPGEVRVVRGVVLSGQVIARPGSAPLASFEVRDEPGLQEVRVVLR